MRTLLVKMLQLTVFMQSVGIFLYSRSSGPFIDYLVMEHGFTYEQAFSFENIFAWSTLLVGAAVLLYPATLLLLASACLTFLLAYITVAQGGSAFSSWTLTAHAARYTAPLVLLLFRHGPESKPTLLTCQWLVVVALSLTFATHGLEALARHPDFTDYIISSGANLAGIKISQSAAETLLAGIGIMDIFCALAILSFTNPYILCWMACWGLITGFARVTELGPAMYGEVIIRAAHFVLPLVALLLFKLRHTAAATAAKPGRQKPPSPVTGNLSQQNFYSCQGFPD
ncbi:hypothetical protein FVR03_10460 [Pontibacter qinzhouensis]|uniref:Uncharacterized protein n=1 Tax=Pontibacter qinzhouensis TaxID=2603253 RepID=A0A5C8KAQ9_9BACT|nr:hypothetical protein [Pontibacter qinzhouensis]TXK46756.1 hypothetical protein FVR03_10460 [Pontibacter qinzhouensis]